MLRITVIALVVANLILIGFGISKPAKKAAETESPSPAAAAPAAPTDPGIPTIHLYSELEQDPGLLADNRHCYTLGPFHSRTRRDALRKRIEPFADHVDERQTEAMVDKGYWVFLPPYATLAEANKTLRFLQLMGLKDVAVLYEGENARGVSLGYFQRQKNALKRKKSLASKGYEPLIRPNRRTEARFWLDYELSAGAEMPALDLENLPVEFEQRAIPCGGTSAAAEATTGDAAGADKTVTEEGITESTPGTREKPVEEAASGGITDDADTTDAGKAPQAPATTVKPGGDGAGPIADGDEPVPAGGVSEPAAKAGDKAAVNEGGEASKETKDPESNRPKLTKELPH